LRRKSSALPPETLPVLTGRALSHRGPDFAVINSDRRNFGVEVGIGFRLGPIFKRNLLLHLRNMAAANKHPTESIGARLGGALEKSHLPTRGGARLGGALEKFHFPTRGNGWGRRACCCQNIKINEEKREAREGRVNFPSAWRPAGMSRHNQPKKTATAR
jgi:hypothetical protein